ncbi:hypothetical protein [Sinomonas atrocyanea]
MEQTPDQNSAPILEAIEEYHRLDRYGFTPPGHRQGRGVDSRTLDALGLDTFRSDLLATAGLDDRLSRGGVLSRAEDLMAEAVGADKAFFSTCGSSLSVKAAILAVTRGRGEILISRDAHKSVTAGLLFSGLQPCWIPVRYDEDLHLAHPPSPDSVEEMWQRHPDAAAAVVVSPTPTARARTSRPSLRSAIPAASRSSSTRRGAHTCRSTTACPRGRWTPGRTSAW